MRENPFFNQGPRAGLFLTMILYRGADIGEKDNIPAGLKNGICFFFFPLKFRWNQCVGPVVFSLVCVCVKVFCPFPKWAENLSGI